jgi:hypothetical protein
MITSMRTRRLLIVFTAVLLLVSLRLFASDSHNARVPDQSQVEVELKPDPRLAQPLDHWPTQADIDRLLRVKGRTPSETIRILGHPSHVGRQENGLETWDYDWLAACRVWFRNGVVEDVFYTAGY